MVLPLKTWLLSSFIAIAPMADLPEGPPFQVVVNDGNPIETLPADEVARIFFRTTRTWSNGIPAQPVDQSLGAVVRLRFLKEVLGQTRGQAQEYWMKRMYSGREVPPPVRDSDEAVLAFVAENPGAIGYVSSALSLPGGVKPLRVVR